MIFVLVLTISLAFFGTGLGLRGLLPGIDYGIAASGIVALSSLAAIAAAQLGLARSKPSAQAEP